MKDIVCGIYKITSPSSKIYIGQSHNIYKRWKGYKKNNIKNQPKLYHSFLKYGVENHKFEIIHICKEEELNSLEEKYVLDFKCVEEGLNIRYGGGSKGKISEEQKEKIRKKLKGIKRSYESIKKQSLTIKNNGVWNKGKKGIFSDEALKKIGKTHSVESIEKTASKLRGRKHTLEHKIKNSEALKIAWIERKKNGKGNHTEETKEKLRQYGFNRKISPETREKISLSGRGRKQSEEHIIKRTLKIKGKKRSDEFRRKMTQCRKLYWENIRQEKAVMIF